MEIFSCQRKMLSVLCHSDIEGKKGGNLKTFVGKPRPNQLDLANHNNRGKEDMQPAPSAGKWATEANHRKTQTS